MTKQSSVAKQISIGGTGGKSFDMVVVTDIALKKSDRLDQIMINGTIYGGLGGKFVSNNRGNGILALKPGEYISQIEYTHDGDVIKEIKFSTSMHNWIGKISNCADSEHYQKIEGIRLISISGRAGQIVDALTFLCLTDYNS